MSISLWPAETVPVLRETRPAVCAVLGREGQPRLSTVRAGVGMAHGRRGRWEAGRPSSGGAPRSGGRAHDPLAFPTMSEVLAVDDPTARDRAVAVLRSGGLVVAPTDTVYGVLVDAFARDATQRLLIARESGRDSPLTVLIRSPRQIIGLTDQTNEAGDRLMAAFWPGPLTLVFQAGAALGWDLGNTRGTVAIRMPADETLHDLIADVGPLACSSANLAGGDLPTTVEEAQAQLGAKVDLYLDGGVRDGLRSTVVDVSRGGAEIRRPGAISADDIVEVATGAVGWGRPTGEQPSEPPAHQPIPDDPVAHEQAAHDRAGPEEPEVG